MRRLILLLAAMTSALVLAVAGAAWVLVAPPPAMAEFPGHNGRIAFMQQDSDGFWQTWVADVLTSRTRCS